MEGIGAVDDSTPAIKITDERHEPHENEDSGISKNQEDSVAELQNNNVRIRFLPGNTLTMNKGSQNLLEMSMAIQLPIELIDYIIKLAVYSSDFLA